MIVRLFVVCVYHALSKGSVIGVHYIQPLNVAGRLAIYNRNFGFHNVSQIAIGRCEDVFGKWDGTRFYMTLYGSNRKFRV